MKLFNRDKEINQIIHILEGEPNFIYFIYGPINSGKTTLIKHIIDNKLNNNYKVFYINFRTYLISEKKDFIEALFNTKKDGLLETIKDKSEVLNLLTKTTKTLTGVPIPEIEFNKLFEQKINDAFQYLNSVLIETKNNGKTPIFILDELQMIKEITTNGQKYLLKELFQFLVSITKEQHLAHCLCLTSDSLFAEYVYNTGELEGRAKYLLIDDFNKQTSLNFIDFLNNELSTNKLLTNEDKERIYNLVGGKPYDIYNVIDNLRYDNLDNILDRLLNDEYQKLTMKLDIIDYVNPTVVIENNIIPIKKEDIINCLKLFKNSYEISKNKVSTPVYTYLIKHNILFLNPQNGILKPQSYLIWNSIKKII